MREALRDQTGVEKSALVPTPFADHAIAILNLTDVDVVDLFATHSCRNVGPVRGCRGAEILLLSSLLTGQYLNFQLLTYLTLAA